jgi:hypothetical protein
MGQQMQCCLGGGLADVVSAYHPVPQVEIVYLSVVSLTTSVISIESIRPLCDYFFHGSRYLYSCQ